MLTHTLRPRFQVHSSNKEYSIKKHVCLEEYWHHTLQMALLASIDAPKKLFIQIITSNYLEYLLRGNPQNFPAFHQCRAQVEQSQTKTNNTAKHLSAVLAKVYRQPQHNNVCSLYMSFFLHYPLLRN